ncbi:MAG: PEP-CTERM sorting domain-containing protein [Phycisphaerales bacterium]|nr:PEP-CTERM sorting domain-containing protein [Phycisphaerales bacterium]
MRTAVVVALCAVSCGAEARDEIVHFVNPPPGDPGYYHWHAPSWDPGGGDIAFLNVTAPPSGQLDEFGPESVGQSGTQLPLTTRFNGGASIAVAEGTSWVLALEHGAALPGREFTDSGLTSAFFETPPETRFPEGARRYIGVLTGGGCYGWIAVVRTWSSFAALSWAYETEPGVGIYAGQVPAPGAGVLMGAGLLGVWARRRRP